MNVWGKDVFYFTLIHCLGLFSFFWMNVHITMFHILDLYSYVVYL